MELLLNAIARTLLYCREKSIGMDSEREVEAQSLSLPMSSTPGVGERLEMKELSDIQRSLLQLVSALTLLLEVVGQGVMKVEGEGGEARKYDVNKGIVNFAAIQAKALRSSGINSAEALNLELG